MMIEKSDITHMKLLALILDDQNIRIIEFCRF